jgi:hypothetical protein
MKNLPLVILILLLVSCTNKKGPNSSIPKLNTRETLTFLTEDTAKYVSEIKNVNALQKFIPNLRKEIPEYLLYLQYLNSDSANGLSIDFIGQVHLGPDASNGKQIEQCQNQIYSMLSDFDYIGIEGSDKFGLVSLKEYTKEDQERTKLISEALGFPQQKLNEITLELISRALADGAQYDAETRAIISGWKNLVGTEPKTLYTVNCCLNYHPEWVTPEFIQLLWDIRSEIALGKMICFIKRNRLEDKKAVILYGVGHLETLTRLSSSIGLNSKWITPCPQ